MPTAALDLRSIQAPLYTALMTVVAPGDVEPLEPSTPQEVSAREVALGGAVAVVVTCAQIEPCRVAEPAVEAPAAL